MRSTRTGSTEEILNELVAVPSPSVRARIEKTLGAMLDSAAWSDLAEAFGLSPRELEIAQLLVCGLTTTEIAQACGIGPTTAKAHQRRIMVKMHVRRRWRLPIKLLLAAGLIHTERKE